MNLCKKCGVVTKNPKFCSVPCSASFNNKLRKRHPSIQNRCKYCTKKIDKRSKACKLCLSNFAVWKKITIGELKAKRKYQTHSRIRDLARKVYRRSNLPKKCVVCGYNKHYDVCHKKAISEYNNNALIIDINAEENLIALCKNHHWEFDNDGLQVCKLMKERVYE